MEPIDESDLDLKAKIGGNIEGQLSREEKITPLKVEQETPQEVISAEKDNSYGKILSKVQTQVTNEVDQNMVIADAQIGSQKIDAESRVQHLVDIAGQKGIVHAVKVAQHMDDNYTLDTFHDQMLVDEFHDALVKKGMIKEL